jgi:hypothetical protein
MAFQKMGSYLLVIWKVQVVIKTSKEIPSVVGGVQTLASTPPTTLGISLEVFMTT